MMRLLPSSLFGRLMLVLTCGLVIAQLLSASITVAERESMLVRASGMRSAQRIADTVKLLDSMGAVDRSRVAAVLSVPPLVVSLQGAPVSADSRSNGPQAVMFSTVLRAALGDDRPVLVSVRGAADDRNGGFAGHSMPMTMGGAMRHGPLPGTSITTQVRLVDGTWARFDAQMSQTEATLPWRLLVTLSILLAAVLLLSYVAVRFVTHPMHVLASAAHDLGRDIHRPPLPETGPVEVRRAAQAFNTMQSRLVRLIEDRTRMLAAMSHDLKTPITRMRLRAELLEDDEARVKFEQDLSEMETMVGEALDFMRGLRMSERAEPTDIMSMLRELKAQNADMGRTVAVVGEVRKPYVGMPLLLKRCFSNLIDNAVLYGERADVVVDDTPSELTIRVGDRGPGIAEDKLETVFEPFVRLEGSRNRRTGGTGLGLCIARDIARAHGGDVVLRNRPTGGLEAIVSLPREEQQRVASGAARACAGGRGRAGREHA